MIVASEHNADFDTIYSDYNGNITNANISGSAAISDSKLAQVTTAGKVSGAALTSLSSVPSGAGLIPVANIDTGTTANKIVILNGSAQLPAVSGVNLTGVTISAALGTWASKSIDTSYQAATDGFVVFYCTDVGNGDSFNICTDSSNPPTTVRGNMGTSSGTTAFSAQLFTPVKKSDYYKVVTVSGTASSYGMYFIPLGT